MHMGLCQWLQLLHQLLLERTRSCADIDGTLLSTRLLAGDQHLLIHGDEARCPQRPNCMLCFPIAAEVLCRMG
jgi:hypothetical protein